MEIVLIVVAAVAALLLADGAKDAINRMARARVRAERRSDRPRR
jgi:hypothetical protein